MINKANLTIKTFKLSCIYIWTKIIRTIFQKMIGYNSISIKFVKSNISKLDIGTKIFIKKTKVDLTKN